MSATKTLSSAPAATRRVMVPATHIDAILTAGLHAWQGRLRATVAELPDPVAWFDDHGERRTLTPQSADLTGAILLDANWRAVRETDTTQRPTPCPEPYSWRALNGLVDAITVLGAIDYLRQQIEHPTFRCEAHAILDALTWRAVHALPGLYAATGPADRHVFLRGHLHLLGLV